MSNTVDSTSDQRTVNNTMRHQYRVLTDEEKIQMQIIKDKGAELLGYMQSIVLQPGADREMNIAAERLEEAVMWAVKAITK